MLDFKKRTREEIRKIIFELGYKILKEYMGNNGVARVVVEDFQGYKYDVITNNLLRKRTPDFVASGNPFSLENICLWLKKEDKPFILCDNNTYSGSKTNLYFKCTREICREVFDMSWGNVYRGQGCPFCSGKRVGNKNNLEYLYPDICIEWDYSKNKRLPKNYTVGSNEKAYWVCSICNFEWTARISHRVNGVGCPRCCMSKGEKRIESWLLSNKILFEREYNKFADCKNINVLSFDFYIPKYNLCIEYNGEQHYNKMGVWGGLDKLKRTIRNDKIKKKYCEDNNVPLLTIPYWDYNKIEYLLFDLFLTLDKR